MGGNLLKHWNLPEKRIPDAEYKTLAETLMQKFARDVKYNRPIGACIGIAKCVRSKKDHGDLDLWFTEYGKDVEATWDPVINPTIYRLDNFEEYIQREFGYKPFRNANVVSFPVDGFQVDVNFVPSHDFNSSLDYSAWGDLGNIMGRIFHKMGLHYGHSGLQFWIRQGMFDNDITWSDRDHLYSKFQLTNDTQKILEIGGFNYSRWLQGFETEEEVFDFVIGSEYFDPILFQLETLNHTNRTRNRKRGMYMRFIEYVNSKTFEPKKKLLPKEIYSLYFQTRFPSLTKEIGGCKLQHDIDKAVKEKINGKIVMEWLGLVDGASVGKIMKFVHETYKKMDLLMMHQDEIKQVVAAYYNEVVKYY